MTARPWWEGPPAAPWWQSSAPAPTPVPPPAPAVDTLPGVIGSDAHATLAESYLRDLVQRLGRTTT